MENVIVTGANGFVGSNLAGFLSNKNIKVHIIVRSNSDLTILNGCIDKIEVFRYDGNLDSLILFFQKTKPTTVFHLASNFIAEHESNQIDSLIDSNIKFGLHLLEAMKQSGVTKLINTGTSWQHFNNQLYNPVCLYAATKQAFESLISYYVEAENFKVITIKLFDTYGENDTRPKLINLLNKFADNKTELNMSAGDQVLNLVHVNDVCDAFFTAFLRISGDDQSKHEIFKIDHDQCFSLKQVIELFEQNSGKKINVNWGGKPYRKREVMTLWTEGERLPDWNAKINLIDGLSLYKQ